MREINVEMVLCDIVGCGVRSGRDKGIHMARIPSINTTQGEEVKKFTEKRRKLWFLQFNFFFLKILTLKDLNCC